jgi:hypothetical protein
MVEPKPGNRLIGGQRKIILENTRINFGADLSITTLVDIIIAYYSPTNSLENKVIRKEK